MTDIDAPIRRNRSAEEFEMRRAIDAWGRKLWPGARVVHELVVGECRIDMAFIERDGLFGVEIKSSADTTERIDTQVKTFKAHLPCVYLALAPKIDKAYQKYIADDRFVLDVSGDEPVISRFYGHPTQSQRRQVTVQMLDLLWASEARSIAMRKRLDVTKSTPLYRIIPVLARALTGDEIVREVCRELRARDAFPKAADHPASDPPIHEADEGRHDRHR